MSERRSKTPKKDARPVQERPDAFFDESMNRRPQGDYEQNYAAGAVEGGFRERAKRSSGDQDPIAADAQPRVQDRTKRKQT